MIHQDSNVTPIISCTILLYPAHPCEFGVLGLVDWTSLRAILGE